MNAETSHAGPQVDLDQILAVVAQEAAMLELGDAEKAEVQAYEPVELEAVHWPAAGTLKLTRLPDQDSYHARDFLFLDDVSFVEAAYQAVLGRPADGEGMNNYVGKLRRGVYRQDILFELSRSQEGRVRAAQVFGIRLMGILGTRVENRRFIGRLARLARRLIDLIHRQRALIWFGQISVNFALFLLNFQKAVKTSFSNQTKQIKALEAEVMLRQAECQQLMARMEQLTAQVRLFDARAASGVAAKASSVEPSPAYMDAGAVDQFYFAFEEACRGSQQEIFDRLSRYLPLIPKQGSRKVIDFGCGRGEWLQVLQNDGFSATGVDISPVMVQLCTAKGLSAQCNDIVQVLGSTRDGSLAAVTGFHVAEHISLDLLLRVVVEARRVLEPGGVLILETPNPENMMVATHTFYHDPTHKNPLTPSLMSFMAEYFGYSEVEILRLNPYPEEAKVPGIDPLTERINGAFLGPQDFALVARKN